MENWREGAESFLPDDDGADHGSGDRVFDEERAELVRICIEVGVERGLWPAVPGFREVTATAIVDAFFGYRFTPAVREVALRTYLGQTPESISSARDSKPGTVRVQRSSIPRLANAADFPEFSVEVLVRSHLNAFLRRQSDSDGEACE